MSAGKVLHVHTRQTMFKIGCSRATVALLQIGELGFIAIASLAMIAAALAITMHFAPAIVERLLIR